MTRCYFCEKLFDIDDTTEIIIDIDDDGIHTADVCDLCEFEMSM